MREVMTMSDQVREAILDSHLSRYEIGKRSGVDHALLCRFMAGTRGISLKTLEQLAPILGISLKIKKSRKRKKGRKP